MLIKSISKSSIPYGLFFVLCIFTSCSFFHRELEWKDYKKYMNDEDNGLVKKKYINHLELTMNYIPADYLVYTELKGDTSYSPIQRDSILKTYSNNLTFVLSIKPDERDQESKIDDVLFYNLKNKEEYTQRMMYLNFDIKDNVILACDSTQEYAPVITNMENDYGLSKGRKITLVFSPLKTKEEFRESKNIVIKWNDEVFETGINYFNFSSDQIFSTPSLKL